MPPQLKTLHLHRPSNEPCPNALAKFVLIEDNNGYWCYHQYAGEVWAEPDHGNHANEEDVVCTATSRTLEKLQCEGECAELSDKLNQVAVIGDNDALIGLVKDLLHALRSQG